MALKSCYNLRRALLAGLLILAPAAAQTSPILTVAPPAKIAVKRGATAEARISVKLQPGFHVNSNTPSESYLIPLRLTWAAGPLESAGVVFPKPTMEKYEFSEKPLSVFTGNFDIATKFRALATATQGPAYVSGKLRYQACNDKACFPPKTVDIKLPVSIQ
jgi:hypothetical protein